MKKRWNDFIQSISEMYISGRNESEISDELAGTILEGEGKIERIDTDTEYTKFIQVYMPRIEIPFKDKLIIADFLSLNFDSLSSKEVKDYKKGLTVQFTTTIIGSNGPFPGISISEFEDEYEINIMPGTKSTKIA